MNYLTTNQSTEMLSFHLHSALCDLYTPSNNFIFAEQGYNLMLEFQEITDKKTTKKNMIFILKKYKKLVAAGTLQVQCNEILANL